MSKYNMFSTWDLYVIFIWVKEQLYIYHRMKTYIINFVLYKYTKVNFKYIGTWICTYSCVYFSILNIHCKTFPIY